MYQRGFETERAYMPSTRPIFKESDLDWHLLECHQCTTPFVSRVKRRLLSLFKI